MGHCPPPTFRRRLVFSMVNDCFRALRVNLLPLCLEGPPIVQGLSQNFLSGKGGGRAKVSCTNSDQDIKTAIIIHWHVKNFRTPFFSLVE